ncbi:hypothetical protein HLB35_01400 [Halomonas sp. TBZ9]|uniref:Uncharacterized protein n=1 Tax=Vreelandella azerica TaxID=2732867 RepID=A0A7Y3TW04_9GAMM|nr:hypothetical protein [Halomonas azerica]NOG30760.1 hypothetical protein [Halomonas azerica]
MITSVSIVDETPAPKRLANQNTFGYIQSTWPSQAIPFALLPYDQRDTREAGIRLMHELATLQRVALVSGNDASRSAMAQWRSVIMAQLNAPCVAATYRPANACHSVNWRIGATACRHPGLKSGASMARAASPGDHR